MNKVTGAERRELHRELRSLIHSWANIWQLPPDVWGSLATQAHERAEEIVRLLELD